MDAYTLLGVSPGVDQHELKRAYRRMAMRWHPDRNADPDAPEQFKALRTAYESLIATVGTPATEDTEAQARAETAAAPADEPAEEPAPPRGADRRMDLSLTLEEAFLGCTSEVVLARGVVCESCSGSGEEALSVSRLCEPCRGSGRLRDADGLARCASCGGRGYRSTQPCSACAGSGCQQRGRTISVGVPAGLVDGDELRLAGEGEPCTDPRGLPGDLRLRIVLAPHPIFRRDRRNLLVQRPVSALRMLIGGELRVPYPGGSKRIVVEPGVAHARAVNVAGAGFPPTRGRPAGDLIVELVPHLPQAPDARVRSLIEQLDAELARDAPRHLPELARWEAVWLS